MTTSIDPSRSLRFPMTGFTRSLRRTLTLGFVISLGATPLACQRGGGLLRQRLRERRGATASTPLPPGTRVLRDLSYGSDPRQRYDVYLPAHPQNAPVILMVHGGGWRNGDKEMGRVVDNKVARWVPQGFIVVSINYRMLPDANLPEQARDVARALAAAQQHAAEWGGDRSRFILMGHSAGAHLIALVAAEPALVSAAGGTTPIGFVILDSAALDVVEIMQHRHAPLYDDAFGSDSTFWRSVSPLEQLRAAAPPMLAVCSSKRAESCPAATAFARKATSLGGRASTLPEDRTHGEINMDLGEPGEYTDAVEAFMRTLDPAVARLLGGR